MYYLWKKLRSGNPAVSPLQCAHITLELSYNSLILSPQTLELSSDQKTPGAGLVWKRRGKKTLKIAKVGASLGIFPGRSSQWLQEGTQPREKSK